MRVSDTLVEIKKTNTAGSLERLTRENYRLMIGELRRLFSPSLRCNMTIALSFNPTVVVVYLMLTYARLHTLMSLSTFISEAADDVEVYRA